MGRVAETRPVVFWMISSDSGNGPNCYQPAFMHIDGQSVIFHHRGTHQGPFSFCLVDYYRTEVTLPLDQGAIG